MKIHALLRWLVAGNIVLLASGCRSKTEMPKNQMEESSKETKENECPSCCSSGASQTQEPMTTAPSSTEPMQQEEIPSAMGTLEQTPAPQDEPVAPATSEMPAEPPANQEERYAEGVDSESKEATLAQPATSEESFLIQEAVVVVESTSSK